MCNCEQVRSVVWEARPAAWDTSPSLAGSHSHNRWGKTSLIGLIHMEQLFIIVAISEQSPARCLYSFTETYYLNMQNGILALHFSVHFHFLVPS